jgi:hypothetical protein
MKGNTPKDNLHPFSILIAVLPARPVPWHVKVLGLFLKDRSLCGGIM